MKHTATFDRMDFGEIDRTAQRHEDENTITFDMRPFRNRQGEAVDWFLHEQVAWAQRGQVSPKLLVLICDAQAEMPHSVNGRLSNLNALGAPHEIRRA